MKRYTMHLIFAAAALAVAAGSASAQNLKAEIPFTFRAGRTLMAPGSYTVKVSRGTATTMFIIQNVDSLKSVILAHYIPGDAPKKWAAEGNPKLGFECAGANCALRTIWPATDRTAYQFRGPRPGGDEPTHVAEVRLMPAKTN